MRETSRALSVRHGLQLTRMWFLLLVVTACCSQSVICCSYSAGTPKKYEEACLPCGNLTECVPRSKHCDNRTDCSNGADEESCGDNKGITDVLGWISPSDPLIYFSMAKRCELREVPERCSCTHKTRVRCGGEGLTDIPTNISVQVTRLFLYENELTVVKNRSFVLFTHLEKLNLEMNHIRVIDVDAFVGLGNLTKLYLDHNQLQTLEPGVFRDLSKLEWLYLNNNQLQVLNAQSFYGLDSLTWLELRWNHIHTVVGEGIWDNMPMLGIVDLESNFLSSLEMFRGYRNFAATLVVRNNSIEVITDHALAELTQLIGLDLSENKIVKFPNGVFRNLSALEMLNISFNPLQVLQRDLFDGLEKLGSLDMRGIMTHNMSFRLFRPLRKLEHIYFSEFRYCGFAPRVRRCKPNTDGISTFENLLANFVLRMSVWVVAIVTCVGNTSVMIGRSIMKHENKVHSLFIRNLCASDLIMGMYLLVIGTKDYMYRNAYNEHSQQWKESLGCQITGFLGMLSAEVTVLLLTYMSVERFLCVVFPYRDSRPNVGQAAVALVIIWLSGVALSMAPVMSPGYFGNFYGSNGVCFPLHLHDPHGAGWEYSAFVFMGLNFVSMIIILCAYTGMFISIQRTRRSIGSPLSLLSDMSFSKRFFFIVLTDSLVWLPITIIKFVALLGVPISGSMYAWIVIFILPINSAINPILYSLTTRTFTNMLGNLVEKGPCCVRKTKSGRLRQQKDEAFSGATYTTGVASVLRPVKCFKVKRSSETATEFSMSAVSTPTCSENNTTKAFVSTIEVPDVIHRSSTLNSVPEIPSLEISGKDSEKDLNES
ncbi:RXFP2 [Branchiostoma lanceolatum]|uniref:RXFP2 protein n=1 Tax=Branchiostoma lanceolatum TaxID=7740 RepID=A0A8K0A1C4_BRALA|nr:RXFP2 [Branchiostoma lanceolatum]